MLQKVPASVHDKILSTLGFTPLAVSTSLSVPVILKYSPILVLDKNKTESTTINPVMMIVRIFVVFTSKLYEGFVSTPRVLKIITERKDVIDVKNKLRAVPAINLCARNFSIKYEKAKMISVIKSIVRRAAGMEALRVVPVVN